MQTIGSSASGALRRSAIVLLGYRGRSLKGTIGHLQLVLKEGRVVSSARYALLGSADSGRAFGPGGGRMAESRLGLPRAAAAAEQHRTRGVDHAARQSEFSWLRRFPALGVGSRRLERMHIYASTSFLALWRSNSSCCRGRGSDPPRTSAIQGPLMGFDRACEKGSLQRANSSARPR